MRDDAGIDHLTPELLVELMEGTPVAVDRRQHLDDCERCREELFGISAALARLKSADPGDAIGPSPSRSIAPSRLRGALGKAKGIDVIAARGGRCAALEPDEKCAIHAAHGGDAKPRACRIFPYTFIETPTEVRVGHVLPGTPVPSGTSSLDW